MQALRHSLPGTLAVAGLFTLLLIWHGLSTYADFEVHQQQLAKQRVTSMGNQVALYIQGLSQNLNLFAKLERDHIQALAAEPQQRSLRLTAWKRLRKQFPTAIAFALTDLYGKSVYISPGSRSDAQDYQEMTSRAPGQALPVDILPTENDYYFRVLTNLQGNNTSAGHLIVSFRCGILCQLLFSDQPATGNPGLANQQQESAGRLVSIVPSSNPGASPDQVEAQIPGTGWQVVEHLNPKLKESKRNQLLVEGTLGLGLATLALLFLNSRGSRRETDHSPEDHCLQGLKDNEHKLAAIVEAAEEGIMLVDAEGKIQLFNPAAEAMFGYTREEIIGKRIEQLIPRSLNSVHEKYLSQLNNHDSSQAVETTQDLLGKRKNGEKFSLHLSVSRYSMGNVTQFVGLMQDISEQLKAKERLDYLTSHDALTGLMNRREFERLLESLLSITDSEDQQHVLCYIDVDQFKVINDTMGHIAGDDLLRQIGVLIKAQVNKTGTVARLGGDEFGVVLRDCSIEKAQELAYSLLQTIGNFLFAWKDKSFEIGVSIGLAAFNPRSEIASNVLSAADVACHMAKEQGRNRIHVYHPGDVDLIRHHGDMHLVSGITQALNEERFHLYAQPIVPIKSNTTETRHYEVLVRMVDESGNLVIPDHFIPAAERYILMPAIDRWIINKLFSTQGDNLRTWSKLNHGRGFLFAINLSGTSLGDEGFLNYIKRQFSKWEIPYNAICFEITETAAIANLGRAKELMSSLKQLGCYFALDDFGAGLSSFSYLKDLPVDYLKIDGSFVRHMTEDPVDYAMVESINQIGHILNLKTIAEWAEDNATVNQLRALNVDFAQGYGVGEPEPMSSFSIDPVLPETAEP